MGDVVAEQFPGLVPVGGAAGGVEKGDVVGVGELVRRGACKLSESDGEDGGADGVLEGLAGAQVGGDR